MCGIIGYTGPREAAPLLIEGLKRLEYRGYDSAGMAIIREKGKVEIHKKKGKISELIKGMDVHSLKGKTGIAHTRWATHGPPSDRNAHPHQVERVVVVHNGIIENHEELKKRLIKNGRSFSSETDTEVIAHLVHLNLSKTGDYLKSVINALRQLKGTYAVLFMFPEKPDFLIGARRGSPLIAGRGNGEFFFASDIPALVPFVTGMYVLEDGDIAVVDGGEIKFYSLDGKPIQREMHNLNISLSAIEKGRYKHFLHKEIMEQVEGITNTILGTIEGSESSFEEALREIRNATCVYLTACGTSYHAGMIGAVWMEELAGIHSIPILSSEERYYMRNSLQKSLLIAISQSGETADTLFTVRRWKEKKIKSIGICNVPLSSLARESDIILFTRAGPEISVASTKAFTSQLTVLFLLALFAGLERKRVTKKEFNGLLKGLKEIPSRVKEIIEKEEEVIRLAREFHHFQNFLYLGRWLNYPVALEGALKLKEISYIHAEGYAAGEMKHGPIALIDRNMPVVFVAPKDRTFSKLKGNIEEVKAREGRIIAVTDVPELLRGLGGQIIEIPGTRELLFPFLTVIPLQLFAYHIAVLRGTDVDQPRNLAKSVTVE